MAEQNDELVPLDEMEDLQDVLSGDGNGQKEQFTAGGRSNTFNEPSSSSIPKTLLMPGGSFINLAMRGNIFSKRLGFALTRVYSKCDRHNYKQGKEWTLLLLAAYCGVNQKRAELVVDAIVGERNRRHAAMGEGMMGKFKSWMSGSD